MRNFEEQIRWYEQNSTTLYDEVIRIEFEKLKSLFESYADYSNELFVEEMIESFFKIIDKQKDKIVDLEMEISGFAEQAQNKTEENPPIMKGEFRTDKELQDAFTAYCLSKNKSSYTVNDYCCRIKNLWRMLCKENESSQIPSEIAFSPEEFPEDTPLVNAYNNSDLLNAFISMRLATAEGNRNWANMRAAYNKLEDFRFEIKLSQLQAEGETAPSKGENLR